MKSNLELYFQQILKENKIPMVSEYKFHPTRRWRFDYADTVNMISAELEGAVWTSGRHTRGAGYIADTEKYNEAVKLGWRVLRYCSVEQIHKSFLTDYKVLVKDNMPVHHPQNKVLGN